MEPSDNRRTRLCSPEVRTNALLGGPFEPKRPACAGLFQGRPGGGARCNTAAVARPKRPMAAARYRSENTDRNISQRLGDIRNRPYRHVMTRRGFSDVCDAARMREPCTRGYEAGRRIQYFAFSRHQKLCATTRRPRSSPAQRADRPVTVSSQGLPLPGVTALPRCLISRRRRQRFSPVRDAHAPRRNNGTQAAPESPRLKGLARSRRPRVQGDDPVDRVAPGGQNQHGVCPGAQL